MSTRVVRLPRWELAPLPMFRYRVILADPPWQFLTYSEAGQGRSAEMHYDTMPLEAIKALRVHLLCRRDDATALFLWGLSSMVPQMIEVMTAWGFDFVTKAFGWAKCTRQAIETPRPELGISHDYNWRMNMGYGTRANTEDCWLGTRNGAIERINKDVRELIVAPMREHSRKPDEIYERIERLYPGPYVELFSRSNRPGWDSWGYEVGKFNEAT